MQKYHAGAVMANLIGDLIFWAIILLAIGVIIGTLI